MLGGILAGLFAGGVLARLAMRVAGFLSLPERQGDLTSNGNRVGEITLSGTIGLALFAGVSSGILGGVLFAAAEPSLRRLRPWHGLTFGVAILLGLGWTVLDPGNIDFLRFGFIPLSLVMFAALFIAYGVAIAWSYDHIRAVIAREGAVARGLEIVVFGAAAGGLAASVAIPIAAGLSESTTRRGAARTLAARSGVRALAWLPAGRWVRCVVHPRDSGAVSLRARARGARLGRLLVSLPGALVS
ncbi:MAG: hypothetical protein ABI888_01895 [Chloroflexota bacterium]